MLFKSIEESWKSTWEDYSNNLEKQIELIVFLYNEINGLDDTILICPHHSHFYRSEIKEIFQNLVNYQVKNKSVKLTNKMISKIDQIIEPLEKFSHYFNCIYCILNFNKNHQFRIIAEECDNRPELVSQWNQIILRGYYDQQKNFNFLDQKELISLKDFEKVQYNYKVGFDEVKYLRKLYQFGQEYGKNNYDPKLLDQL